MYSYFNNIINNRFIIILYIINLLKLNREDYNTLLKFRFKMLILIILLIWIINIIKI